jgi:uncharacterized protein YkwD
MFNFFRKVLYILLLSALVWFGWNYSAEIKKYNFSNLKEKSVRLVLLLQNKLNFKESQKGNSLAEKENPIVEEDKQDEFNGTTDALITLINKERFDRKLEPLKKNSLLMMSAKLKAEDMVRNKYFEHISETGIQPWFFAEKVGYQYETFGENIAEKYFSANSVHKAFMDSRGHRVNILNKEFRDVGVAILPVKINNRQQFVVVEHFGSYLRDINLAEARCGEKNRQRCKIQKKKRKGLLKMIKEQKKIIKGMIKDKDNSQVEVVTNNSSERLLKDLNNIKEEIGEYLVDCQKIKDACK